MTNMLSRSMRIGVNLMFLIPGEVGGSEPLLINLVREMGQSDHELVIFAVKGFASAYPEISASSEVVEVPWAKGAQGLRIMAEHSWLQLSAKKRGLDLLHHGVGTAPFIRSLASAVTIHDIQFRHYPENFVLLKRWWLKTNVPFSIRHSNVVTVPSEWVKQDIENAYSLPSDNRVMVVPFGSENLFPPDAPSVDEVRNRFALDRDYFLFPGRSYPHKNHEFLVSAFAPLSDRADLVLTGAPWFRDELVAEAARELGIADEVRMVGLVERDELAALYRGAVALTYPSKFEGFGAPALEAMTLGCPVIASNVCAIPEVVGESGLLLDPDDESAWQEAMDRLLTDREKREQLIREGISRAQEFTWGRAAQAQIAAYEQAIS